MKGFELLHRTDPRVSGLALWCLDAEIHAAYETLPPSMRRQRERAQAALARSETYSNAKRHRLNRKIWNRIRKVHEPHFYWWRQRTAEEIAADEPFLGVDRNPNVGRLAGMR